jgi:hypothetical protein
VTPADCLRYLAACAVVLRIGVDRRPHSNGDLSDHWIWRDLRRMAFDLEYGGEDERAAVVDRLRVTVDRYATVDPKRTAKKTLRAADLYRRALREAEAAV